MNTTNTYVCVLAAVATLACNQAPSRAEDDPPPNVRNDGADFYGLMRRVHYDFQPIANSTELRTRADLVVRGNFASVVDGRTLGGPSGDIRAFHTAILNINVREVLKGSKRSHLYLEIPRSLPTGIDELDATLPENDDILLYLVPASTSGEIHDARRGLPPGETSYQLVNPQALVVEVTDGLVHPLVARDLWPTGERWAR